MKVEKIKEITNMVKSAELSGVYIISKLDGVDFTKEGEGVDDKTNKAISWDTTIKLKFIMRVDASKTIDGIEIKTSKMIQNIVKVPVSTKELATKVNKFNQLIGKDFLIPVETKDNASFSALEQNVFELV